MAAAAVKYKLPSCIALLLFFFIRCSCAAIFVCGNRFGAAIDGLESDFEVFSEHVRRRLPLGFEQHLETTTSVFI